VEFGHLGKMLWHYIWVAGRLSKRHKRYIREENNKSNKQVMDKLLINTDVSISVILVNAVIFIVIVTLREDPLSPGILDMFFRKYSIMCLFSKREFICLENALIFN
jgi:hypothetical protein